MVWVGVNQVGETRAGYPVFTTFYRANQDGSCTQKSVVGGTDTCNAIVASGFRDGSCKEAGYSYQTSGRSVWTQRPERFKY